MRGIAVVGAAFATLALAAPAQGALECGDSLTGDRKLKHDLVNCPDRGLYIADDGATLDMNGHEIRAADDFGIDAMGSKNVTIKNGAIRNGNDSALVAVGTDRLTVNNLDIINPGGRGVHVTNSNGVTIKKTVVRRAPNDAFYFVALTNATATDVAVAKGDGTGFDISNVEGLTVENASVIGDDATFADGMVVTGDSVESEFIDIEIEGWGGIGFQLDATGADNLISGATSRSNEYGFLISEGEARIRNSAASGNNDDGLLVNGIDGVRVTKGRFNNNDDEGIQFNTNAIGAVGDNVANNNGDAGIQVPPTGVTDLGGNSATGNAGANCVNVSC